MSSMNAVRTSRCGAVVLVPLLRDEWCQPLVMKTVAAFAHFIIAAKQWCEAGSLNFSIPLLVLTLSI